MLDPMLDLDLIRPDRIRPLSRREYDKLVGLGVFDDEKLELLRGMLVTMSPQKEPHARMVEELNRILILALDDRYRVRPQLPFAASDDSEPEPDFLITTAAKTHKEHPLVAELVIEVAASSLRKDRRIKTSIYAENGVPEYWIFNMREQVVEVLSDPRDGVYAVTTVVGRTATLHSRAIPQLVIDLETLMWLPVEDDDE